MTYHLFGYHHEIWHSTGAFSDTVKAFIFLILGILLAAHIIYLGLLAAQAYESDRLNKSAASIISLTSALVAILPLCLIWQTAVFILTLPNH